MAVSDPPPPAAVDADRPRAAVLLLFAATGGAVAWTVQLWLNWLIADLGCQAQPGEWTLLGFGVAGWWVLIGLACAALAGIACLVAYRVARAAAADGPRRFIAASGFALNVLLLGTIVLGATSPLFVPPCV